MRAISAQELETLSTSSRPVSLGSETGELPDVNAVVPAVDLNLLVKSLQSTTISNLVTSRGGSKAHLPQYCLKDKRSFSARVDLLRVESTLCTRCVKNSSTDPDIQNLVVWSQVAQFLSPALSAQGSLDRLNRNSTMYFTPEQLRRNIADNLSKMKSVMSRIDPQFASITDELSAHLRTLESQAAEAEVPEVQEQLRQRALEHAALSQAMTNRATLDGFVPASAFCDDRANIRMDKSALTRTLRSYGWNDSFAKVVDAVDNAVKADKPRVPESWNSLPDQTVPRRPDQSTYEWMLESWEAEFDREHKSLIEAVTAEIENAIAAMDGTEVKVSVQVSDIDQIIPRRIYRMLQPFGIDEDATGMRFSATVPAIIAGAVKKLETVSDDVKKIAITHVRSADKVRLRTALDLMDVSGQGPTRNLVYALQAADDILHEG